MNYSNKLKKWYIILPTFFFIICIILILSNPRLFLNDIESYLSNKIYNLYQADCDIGRIDGNFIKGFNINSIKIKKNNDIIVSIPQTYIDFDLSSIILGRLIISDLVLNNTFINFDIITSQIPPSNFEDILYNFKIRSFNAIDGSFLYNNKLYKINFDGILTVNNIINFEINNIVINSKKINYFLEIVNGSIKYSNNKLELYNIKSISEDFSFNINECQLNLSNLIKSNIDLIINKYHHFVNDSIIIDFIDTDLRFTNINNKLKLVINGDIKSDNINLSHINLNGEYVNDSNLLITNSSIEINGNKLAIKGDFNPIDISWTLYSVIKQFNFYDEYMFSGNMVYSGKYDDDNIYGTFSIDDLFIDSVLFPPLSGNYKYYFDSDNLNMINIISEDLNASIYLEPYFNKDKFNVSTNIKINNLSLKKYISFDYADSLSGTVDIIIVKDNSISKLILDANINNGNILGNAFKNLNINLNAHNNNKLFNIVAKGNLDDWIYGPYDWEDINYDFKYGSNDTSSLKIIAASTAGDSLYVQADKLYGNNYATIISSGIIKQSKITIEPFIINMNKNNFIIPSMRILLGESISDFRFSYNNNNYQLNSNISNLNLSNFYSIIGKTSPIHGNIINAEFSIEKNYINKNSKPIILINANLENGRIDDINYRELNLSCSYRNNRLLFNDLYLETNLGSISGDGWININLFNNNYFNDQDKLKLAFNYENIDIFKFNRYLPWSMEAKGLVSGNMNLSGTVYDPKYDSDIRILNPSFDAISGNELVAKLNYYNKRLYFKNILLDAKYGKYYGHGYIPIDLNFNFDDKQNLYNKPIDFMFTGKANNIDFLASYFDLIDSLKSSHNNDGEYSYYLQLLISGSIKKPIRNGKLIIKNGSLYIDAINEPIHNIVGNISINNNNLIIEKLNGKLYKEKKSTFLDKIAMKFIDKHNNSNNNINIYGSMDISTIFSPAYAIQIVGNDVSMSSSYDKFNGTVDLDIGITGKDTVLISGEIIPSSYDFTITSLGNEQVFDLENTYSNKSIKYDIHTPIKDAIKVKTDNMNFFVEGDLNIIKENEENFNFSGEANIIEGSFYDNQGNIFQNTFGTIIFSPINNTPYIDLNAQTEVDGNLIDIAFIGYTENPTLLINSPNHDYTQTEILKILTFGNIGENIVASENASNLLTNFIENEIEKNISQYTPLDEFQLSSNSSILSTLDGNEDVELKLVMGKQFTNRIYLNTEVDMNNIQNSKYKAVYRLNKRASIVGGIDLENKWHFSYQVKYYY